jgi:DNA-binding response OmpR family regulator
MLNASGKDIVRGRVAALEEERDEAEEFCDTQTVQRCQAEIDALSSLLKASSATDLPDEKVARAVEKEVRAAIAAITKHSRPLGDHLSKNLQIGSVYWYRRTGVAWDIVPLPVTAATQTGPAGTPGDGVVLVIDIPNQRVTFRGQEIPTTPPNHLQPQAILALAALAQRAGEAVTMAEVADRIWKLGGLARKPTSPDQRDLKYKLMNPFTKALPGGEAKRLIEAVRGTGLRLNLRPEAVRIVLRDGGDETAKQGAGRR